ncbi:MAG: MoaD/ThiS family protein [Pseudomonadota bacterium]
MRLSIKTTGLLGKFLPEGSQRNRGEVELPAGSTVRDLLNTLAIPDDGRCYVSINDSMLRADELDTTVLDASDKIVLMAPISAG